MAQQVLATVPVPCQADYVTFSSLLKVNSSSVSRPSTMSLSQHILAGASLAVFLRISVNRTKPTLVRRQASFSLGDRECALSLDLAKPPDLNNGVHLSLPTNLQPLGWKKTGVWRVFVDQMKAASHLFPIPGLKQ